MIVNRECPGCGRIVVLDTERKMVKHEFPECNEFLKIISVVPPDETTIEVINIHEKPVSDIEKT